MKEYLPYFNNLDKKYKDIYMEWSKEELIDHLVANIKNSEELLSRIEKAIQHIETIQEQYNKESAKEENIYLFVAYLNGVTKLIEVKGILKGEI